MIIVCTGNSGSGKTAYSLLKAIENLKRGRLVASNSSYFWDRGGISGSIYLDDQKLLDFWKHVSPGSFIIVDEVSSSLLSKIDRKLFFDRWFTDHLRSGTDLLLISQNLPLVSKFFHHYNGDPVHHKCVNVDNVLSITPHKIFGVRFSILQEFSVDNSYLNHPHFDRQPGFKFDLQRVQCFSPYRTVLKVDDFFKEASK